MNDVVEKTASSLAVVEKKPQRLGGCVGILFQLFDWNRRFAKKKLFSKKLLPPVRSKLASKKLAGNEKQPKLRLIADENSGGFPRNRVRSGTLDVEQKHETRVPGLVARLMGLESMPALHRGNSKKFPAERFVDNVEKEDVMLELRSQKLQKTIVCEMEQLNTFSSEKLPLKNVVSKSRKHHPRLPSPVKTPRSHSRRSSSKLIGAATRILEPGLRPSKLKCAITYSDHSCHSPYNTLVEERCLLRDSDGSSCVAAKDSTAHGSKHPFVFSSSLSHYDVPICHGPERKAHRQSAAYQVIEEELSQEYSNVPSPHMDHVHPHVGLVPEKNPFYGQAQQYSGGRQCKHLMGVPVSVNSTDRTCYAYRMSRARSRALGRIDLNNLASNTGSTSTTMNNEGLHGSIALRIPSRMDNDHFELGRRTAGRAQTAQPPGRKRRPSNNINTSIATEHSTLRKHAERRVHNDLDTHYSSQISSEESGRRKKVLKPNPLSGDELGALLEQKLKELTCQGEDNGGNAPKKTTATILEELISALTTEANVITEKQAVDLPLDCEHPSPGSVLEPYFSIESCLSGSIDDSFGHNTLNETVDDACQSPKAYSEFLDSAASKEKSSKEAVVDILRNVSESLCCSDNANLGLNQDKYDYAKKVLLNAELFFRNAFISSSLVGRGSPIKHLLLDELEMLAGILWMKFGYTPVTGNSKEVDELQRFAFDAIIEYLNSRFGGQTADGSALAAKLRIRMTTDALIFEVVEAVGRWKESSRFSPDELIDWEMSHSLGEWTQYETETYEEGSAMSRHLLQSLMDEIVIDLCDR